VTTSQTHGPVCSPPFILLALLYLGFFLVLMPIGFMTSRLCHARPKEAVFALFWSGLYGLVALSTLTAVFLCRGTTFLWFYVPLLILLSKRPPQPLPAQQTNMKRLLTLVPLAGLSFAFCFYSIRPNLMPSGDIFFYANNCRLLLEQGVETYFSGPYCYYQSFESAWGLKPYHWVDQWLGAFLLLPELPVSDVQVYALVLYPTLWTIAIWGMAAVGLEVGLSKKPVWTIAIAASLSLFLVGAAIPNFSPGHEALYLFKLNALMDPEGLVTRPKLCLYLIFFCGFLLESLRAEYKRALVCLLFAVVHSPTAWPGVFIGVAAATLTSWVLKKQGSKLETPMGKEDALATLLTTIGLGVGFVVFYAILGPDVATDSPESELSFGVRSIGGWAYRVSVFLLPNLLVLNLVRRDTNTHRLCWPLSVLGLVIGGGSIGWLLIYNNHDANQLFYNVAMPAIILFTYLGCIVLISKKSALGWALLLALALLGFSKSPPLAATPAELPAHFVQQVNNVLRAEPAGQFRTGVAFKQNNTWSGAGHTNIAMPTRPLVWCIKGFAPVSLSDLQLDLSEHPAKRSWQIQSLRHQSLFRYTEDHISTQPIANFVNALEIRYILVHGVPLPKELTGQSELIIKDETGTSQFLTVVPIEGSAEAGFPRLR
jgi:hypothetical protein